VDLLQPLFEASPHIGECFINASSFRRLRRVFTQLATELRPGSLRTTASFRALAPALVGFQGLAFLPPGGITAWRFCAIAREYGVHTPIAGALDVPDCRADLVQSSGSLGRLRVAAVTDRPNVQVFYRSHVVSFAPDGRCATALRDLHRLLLRLLIRAVD